MFLLSLDTSMGACSAALVTEKDQRVAASRYCVMARGHAEAIAPMVRAVLAEASIGFTGLSGICTTIGPGTFTGLRIGLSFVHGLMVSLKCPAFSIDSLRAIAANADGGKPCAVIVEARNDEVYFACYAAGGVEHISPRLIKRAEVQALLPQQPLQFLGTAAADFLRSGDRYLPERNFPRAAQFAAHAATLRPSEALPQPLYLRGPDAKPQYEITAFAQPSAPAAALLSALHAKCFDAGWSQGEFSQLLSQPGSLSLILTHNGEASGLVLARRAVDEAEIITFGITLGKRKKGFGRALLKELESRLKAAGASHIFLEVAEDNASARALYSRQGFTEAGRRKGYYQSSGADALVLKKQL